MIGVQRDPGRVRMPAGVTACDASPPFENFFRRIIQGTSTTIAYTNSGALEKNGSGAFCLKFGLHFLFQDRRSRGHRQ